MARGRSSAAPYNRHLTSTRTTAELSDLARRHLWMHFARLGGYDDDHPVNIITRGEGCYVWDATGKRLLDGLSGLFTVQVGHGRRRSRRGCSEAGGATGVLPDLELCAPARDRARRARRRSGAG